MINEIKRILSLEDESVFGKNLLKYAEFCSWARWYPDLFLDLIKPQSGGINLDVDQRIFLRAILRFVGMYGVMPRGYSKTFLEVLASELVCIMYPGITVSLTAQTKENAADLIKDKHLEIMKYYPILENEIRKVRFSKNDASVEYINDSRLDNLANAQSSKGQRRTRINIEEAALLNDALYQDALAPIVEIGRNTVGKLGITDPCELNQQINFLTTSGFRGSDEYARNLQMYKNMIDLKGTMVLGASWFLACWFGRGSTKSQILQKKRDMMSVTFAQNYECKWVGSTDGALVNINKLLSCRNLTKTVKEYSGNNPTEEYYMGVDVARSQKTSNNKSSICVVRVKWNKTRTKILSYDVVNIINMDAVTNFTGQAVEIKRIAKRYNVVAVVCDGNGLGAGLIDELLKDTYDPVTRESLGCWDTINDDNIPENPDDAKKILYNLKAQGLQSSIVSNFISLVDSGKLRLLEKKRLEDFTLSQQEDYDNEIAPFDQTDALVGEIANLKLKILANNSLTMERVVRKIDKDRVSALIYILWYINENAKEQYSSSDYDYTVFIN